MSEEAVYPARQAHVLVVESHSDTVLQEGQSELVEQAWPIFPSENESKTNVVRLNWHSLTTWKVVYKYNTRGSQ